ncbi:MAG: serine/threonine-protein kinase [Oscillochloridaceae bacterium umkhey_bin13]
MSSLIGRRLGRYELRAELGRGGMARVYQATDTLLQRQVALKILAAQLSLDDEFVRRFEREAATAANLRHPAIVTIYDVGEQDGLYYIAMELVHGRSLHAVLEERSTLGLGYAVSLLDPVARALDFAHEQGAVHRDIKPHNILLDHNGRVLLTDFGIAQTPDSDGDRLTRTGVFMGTPEYISPEQAEARRVDGRSDLYSLAVVAYEIITGRVPFVGATPQLIVAHSQQPPPPPSSVQANLPSELDEVLTRALAKRAERRYPTGMALVEALRAVAARAGTPMATPEQVAALATPGGQLPTPPIPQPIPALPPRARPAPVLSSAGQPTAREPVLAVTPPRAQPAPRPPMSTPRPVRPLPPTRQGSDLVSQWPQIGLGVLLIGVTIMLLLAVAQGLAGLGAAGPPPTLVPPPPPTSTPQPTSPPPTEAPGLVGSALPLATATPEPPTATTTLLPIATTTQVLPTATLVRPTLPPLPPTLLPTVPLVPTATLVPTNTPLPTETTTPNLSPTATETPSPTITLTPTITPTDIPPVLEDTPIPLTPELPPYPVP